MNINFGICVALCATLIPTFTLAQTYLRADGVTDTYTLINRVMGQYATGEMPDCGHNVKHVTQGNDGILNRQLVYFHAHVNQDDDRCGKKDRQRTEIRPDQGALTGGDGDYVSHAWNFKLDAGFQASNTWTHIHQLKAVGGDDSMPIMTIQPRNNEMLISHIDSSIQETIIGRASLDQFRGTWVHVQQEVRYGYNGRYRVTITRVDNGERILHVDRPSIDMWRHGTTYVRPKWGIYRSLNNIQALRDETVRFDSFCMGKNGGHCP